MFCCRRCKKNPEEQPLLEEYSPATVVPVEHLITLTKDHEISTIKETTDFSELPSSEMLTDAEESFFRIQFTQDPSSFQEALKFVCADFDNNILEILTAMVLEKNYESYPVPIFRSGVEFYKQYNPEILEESLVLFSIILPYRTFRRMIVLLDKLPMDDMEPFRPRVREKIDSLITRVDFQFSKNRTQILDGLTEFSLQTKSRKLIMEIIQRNSHSPNSCVTYTQKIS